MNIIRERPISIACSVLMSIVTPMAASAQTGKTSHSTKVNELFEDWDQTNSPGASVVIVKDGEIILEREYGMANLEYNAPITSSTVFHVGSVSKQFTAFSILFLEDRGMLSLDDDVRRYLPEVPDFGQKVSLRRLIHHTSGLKDHETLLQLCGISNADVIETQHILKLVQTQKELNFRPGDELEYCNMGYVLLAAVVESVTDQSFRDWTAENIFAPLGMNNSQFYDDCTRIVRNRAYPYWMPEGVELVKGTLNYSYVGPTSLFTTSADMAKWLINFGHPTVGGEQIMNRMMSETAILNDDERSTYGFGVGVTEYRGLKIVLHSGHDAGYRAFNAYFSDYDFGVAILSNFYSVNVMKLGLAIADIYLADELEPEEEDQLRSPTIEDNEPESADLISAQGKQLAEYTGGFYAGELGTHYQIILRDGKLLATHWRNEDVILSPLGADLFAGDKWWFKQVQFLRDDEGRLIGFRLTTGRVRNLLFSRM